MEVCVSVEIELTEKGRRKERWQRRKGWRVRNISCGPRTFWQTVGMFSYEVVERVGFTGRFF